MRSIHDPEIKKYYCQLNSSLTQLKFIETR